MASTTPGLMLQMLQALDITAGHPVLEVATGTSYNAALVSERLGSDLVTTIEVDPALAGAAHARLKGCGYTPLVATGDGRAGRQARAPYDRLIATCGFTAVPAPRLQVRPGGVIVCPLRWGTVRPTVRDDGRAESEFLATPSYFMAVGDAGTTGTTPHPGRPAAVTDRPTSLDLAAVASDKAFPFVQSLAVFCSRVRLGTRRRCPPYGRGALGRGRLLGSGREWSCTASRAAPAVGRGRGCAHAGRRARTARPGAFRCDCVRRGTAHLAGSPEPGGISPRAPWVGQGRARDPRPAMARKPRVRRLRPSRRRMGNLWRCGLMTVEPVPARTGGGGHPHS
ncbi:hypothetical protein [Streptomyces sp. NPDC003710]